MVHAEETSSQSLKHVRHVHKGFFENILHAYKDLKETMFNCTTMKHMCSFSRVREQVVYVNAYMALISSSSGVVKSKYKEEETSRLVSFFVSPTHFNCFIFILIEKEKYG